VKASSGLPSVNALASAAVERLVADATALRLSVTAGDGQARIIDAGANVQGGIEAGRRIAEICLGGLGCVSIGASGSLANWPFSLTVTAANPVLACLGSQYAGWSLRSDAPPKGYFAMGSGPARAAATVESLFEQLNYRDRPDHAVLVLEADTPPPDDIIMKVAEATSLPPAALTFIFAPTQSLAGSTQIVARVLEVGMHKAHVLGFPLERIVDGVGTAPLAPPSRDFLTAMGRTNDAIIYGGRIHLFVSGADSDAKDLAHALPSTTARDHGALFSELFQRFDGDFYAIDPHLFSPAEVIVSAIDSGRSYRAGRLVPELIDLSFA
jgi:methenyltetrahydromethanopterin cyclohydrolase